MKNWDKLIYWKGSCFDSSKIGFVTALNFIYSWSEELTPVKYEKEHMLCLLLTYAHFLPKKRAICSIIIWVWSNYLWQILFNTHTCIWKTFENWLAKINTGYIKPIKHFTSTFWCHTYALMAINAIPCLATDYFGGISFLWKVNSYQNFIL